MTGDPHGNLSSSTQRDPDWPTCPPASSAATTEVEMNDPLHDALVAIFGAIAEREEKSIEEVVAEFVEGYERG